jgi:hypothetical protein
MPIHELASTIRPFRGGNDVARLPSLEGPYSQFDSRIGLVATIIAGAREWKSHFTCDYGPRLLNVLS